MNAVNAYPYSNNIEKSYVDQKVQPHKQPYQYHVLNDFNNNQPILSSIPTKRYGPNITYEDEKRVEKENKKKYR